MKHLNTFENIKLFVFVSILTMLSGTALAQCEANAGPDLTVCAGESFTLGGAPSALNGTAPYSYDWSGLSGANDVANPTITLNSTTTFTLTITDNAGCTSSDQVTVTVTPAPVANAGADLDPCVNTANITLPSGGTWSGAPATMLNGNIFNPNTVGTYTLTYTVTSNGCSATDTKEIIVRPRPTVNAGADAVICPGACLQLNAVASSANGPITLYSWSGGPLSSNLGQSPIACPTGSGATYSVTVVDSESCNAQDQITITFQSPVAVNAGPDLTLCNNSNPVALSGNSPAGGAWSGTGINAAGQFVSPGVGSYTITYTHITSAGCSYSDTRQIDVVDSTPVDAGNNMSACVGAPAFQLNPVTPGGTWSGSAFVTSGGLFTPSVLGSYNLVYTVNTGVCTSTDNISVTVFGLPTIDAGSNQSMCAGSSVVLNGSASGGLPPYNVSWTNGTSLSNATVLNPTATPNATTSYTLTVVDGRGCSASDFATVTVNSIPTVNAGNDQTICDQSGPVQLTGQSPAGGSWSGSCVSAGGQFTPCGVGTFVLTYTYVNPNGCSASDDITITVTSSPSINAGPDQSVCRNEGYVNLGANASVSGTWSGAGIIDPISGIFDPISAGTGNHTLTLTMGTGVCQVTDQVAVQVKAEPNVNAGNAASMCLNVEPLELYGTPYNGVWEGDGVIEESGDDYYMHAAVAGVGAHTLLYRYTDVVTTCSDTAYKNVTVNPLPTSSFSVPADACVNSAITPSNSSTGAASYSWNFGEGSDVAGTAPSHSYNTLGDYDIRLIATSNTSCKDTSYQTIHVVSAPTLVLSADVTNGCGPLDVNFSTNITGLVSSYAWNFGNATGSTSANPGTQIYTAATSAASYTAQLTVSNACGVATDDIQINVQPQPVASFNSVITSTVCSPLSVEFQNTSIGDVSNCTWDFGDGEVMMIDDPEERVYTTSGGPTTYTVELSVSNSCGTSTTTQDITVQPNLVHASIQASAEEGCTPFVVDLANNGTGGTSFTYEYSNGNTQVGSDVQYTFDASGEFTVYQYATDGCGFDTAFVVLTALQTPQVDFIASADEACAYGEITFDADVVGASQIEWTFGDGVTSNDEIVNKSYTTGGTYTVTLEGVADNQCSSSTSMEVDIHSNPVAHFSVASNEGCAPFDICPLNGSIGATTTHWDFGDGIVSNETQPCHTFQNFGQNVESNHVILTVENTFGCADTYELQVDVNPLPPSNFELGQTSSCEFPIFLDPVSVEDGALAYNWTVDGDPASSDQHPNLLFASPGSFYVQLVTANEYGCTKMSDATFVVNEPAVANFEVDKNNGCLDLLVNFTNTSTNGLSYSWNFGDGDFSQNIQPSHTYDQQGVFDVTLTVTSPDGCVDTKTLHNVVETYPLPVADFRPSITETSIFNPSVEFENQSEDGVEYQWYFGGSATSFEENPTYEFTAPGHWAVTLVTTNMFGCEDRITKNVTITNDFQVYIPNSFTPNNDGLNDVFRPELDGRDFITKYEFTVFNRWGEKVFETNDPKLAWTGDSKSNGYYSPNETFSYQLVIQLEQSAETKVYRGLVTMVR